MTILVDMDDTMELLLEAMVRSTNRKYHRNASVDDVTDWDMVCAYPGLTKRQILDSMCENGFWDDIRPVPGAPEALKHFMDEGHDVYVVTATEFAHIKGKMEGVLFRYFPFIPWDHVIITSKKQMIRGDVLIDDGVHNLEGGAYKKILITAPYNKDYDAEGNGMIRVHSWDEIVSVIDAME
ncbi:MAG: hypothetical protein Q4G19_00430 [Clostridia bacterium]|nr:hypothetical protein [Clostridia bacterium]